MKSSTGSNAQTIGELADLLGRFRYVELALFEIVGRAVANTSVSERCVALSGASHAHAYRAELIERRFLVSVGLPHVIASTRAPSTEHQRLLEALRPLDARALIAQLALVWYPSMLDAYRVRLLCCSEASDRPIRRMLGRLIYDLGSIQSEILEVHDVSCLIPGGWHAALNEAGGAFGTLIS